MSCESLFTIDQNRNLVTERILNSARQAQIQHLDAKLKAGNLKPFEAINVDKYINPYDPMCQTTTLDIFRAVLKHNNYIYSNTPSRPNRI